MCDMRAPEDDTSSRLRISERGAVMGTDGGACVTAVDCCAESEGTCSSSQGASFA